MTPHKFFQGISPDAKVRRQEAMEFNPNTVFSFYYPILLSLMLFQPSSLNLYLIFILLTDSERNDLVSSTFLLCSNDAFV